MLYLVDNTIDRQGASPREIRSALERLRPELEVVVEPFSRASLERIEQLSPSHIILSGQSHPWDMYSDQELAGVYELVRNPPKPILGICGGHQQIALALGAPVGLMERLEAGEGYVGAKRERGFLPVETDGDGLFRGLPICMTVWHSHCDEVKGLPEGFRCTASNATCAIQAMQHKTQPVFGVQFHPELFNDDHPDGRLVLENFLAT